MFYDFTIAIPAETEKDEPETERVKLTAGMVHRVEIEFPPGCAKLAHIQIYSNGHQVWPTNPDGDFASDAYTIAFDERYELTGEPYELRIVGWNEDDTLPHTITVRIGILPVEVFVPPKEELGILQRLEKLIFGR